MTNSPQPITYTGRLTQAFEMAFTLHKDQTRKGSNIPYLTHLIAVAAIVGEHGGEEDQVIAALLHDAAEDQGGPQTLDLIQQRFGPTVARYVHALSDTLQSPKPPWRERKERFLRSIQDASPQLRLIIAADKLHNTRTMIRDLNQLGSALWDRFNAPRDQQLWYAAEILRALAQGWDHPILQELASAIDTLHRLAFQHQD